MDKEIYAVISDHRLMDLTELYKIDNKYLLDRIFGNEIIRQRRFKINKIKDAIRLQ